MAKCCFLSRWTLLPIKNAGEWIFLLSHEVTNPLGSSSLDLGGVSCLGQELHELHLHQDEAFTWVQEWRHPR